MRFPVGYVMWLPLCMCVYLLHKQHRKHSWHVGYGLQIMLCHVNRVLMLHSPCSTGIFGITSSVTSSRGRSLDSRHWRGCKYSGQSGFSRILAENGHRRTCDTRVSCLGPWCIHIIGRFRQLAVLAARTASPSEVVAEQMWPHVWRLHQATE